MKVNSRKYLRLDNAIMNASKNVEKHSCGFHYNPMKRYAFEAKQKEFEAKQAELVKILTEEEKTEIEDFYGCGEMFDRIKL